MQSGLIVNATNRPIAAIGPLAISPARGLGPEPGTLIVLRFSGGEAILVYPKLQVFAEY